MSVSRLYASLDLLSRAYFPILKPLHWSPCRQQMTRPKSYKVLLWKIFLYLGVLGIYSIHLILVAWKVITKNPEFMKHEQLPLKLIFASLIIYAFQLTFSL